MKKIQLIVLSLICFGFAASAQTKKVVINTPSVQCDMCKDRIEKYIAREDGVSAVKVDLKKKTTTVTFLTDRNNVEQLKTAIANRGYDADDVTAEESAYNKLPMCCKKPAPPSKETKE